MTGICARCKLPFAALRKPDTHHPTATWRAEVCPDCAAPKNPKQDTTLDCVQYIRPDRVSARLRDGFAMFAEDGG